MGKLKIPPVVMYLIVPLIVITGILSVLNLIPNPVTATLFGDKNGTNQPTLSAYLRTENEYSQVVIKYQDQEMVLTNDRFNNVDVFTRGEYVVWIRELPEESQVVRYHVPNRQDLTIATDGIFEHPRVDKTGNVTWQRWRNEDAQWYISYYDGQEKQLSRQGLHPDIQQNLLIYSRRTGDYDWELVQVNLSDNTEQVLLADPSVKQAWYDSDAIQFPGGTVSLNPSPSPMPENQATLPPFVETVPNPPDQVEGEPSEVPPGDARLFAGETNGEVTQDKSNDSE